MRAVDVPIYDFATHQRSAEVRRVEPADVVIIEGILVLHMEDIRSMLNMKIFVDTDDDLRLARRCHPECFSCKAKVLAASCTLRVWWGLAFSHRPAVQTCGPGGHWDTKSRAMPAPCVISPLLAGLLTSGMLCLKTTLLAGSRLGQLLAVHPAWWYLQCLA
jgi:hypothetical protein